MIIEKGIPLPTNARTDWSFLEKMEIGDSVFIPEVSGAAVAARATQKTSVAHMRFKTQCKKGMGGTRIWRIA